MNNNKERGFSFLDSSIVFALSAVIIAILGIGGAFLVEAVGNDELLNIIASVVLHIALIALCFVFSKIRKVNLIKAVNAHQKPTKWAIMLSACISIIALAGMPIILGPLVLILQFLGYPIEAVTTAPLTTIIFIILAVLFAPISEELIFRGVLVSGTRNKHIALRMAMSGLLFALIHVNITQTIYQALLGAVWALLVIKCKSIYPAIIGHFINNSLAMIMSNTGDVGSYAVLIACWILLAPAIVFLILIIKKKGKFIASGSVAIAEPVANDTQDAPQADAPQQDSIENSEEPKPSGFLKILPILIYAGGIALLLVGLTISLLSGFGVI